MRHRARSDEGGIVGTTPRGRSLVSSSIARSMSSDLVMNSGRPDGGRDPLIRVVVWPEVRSLYGACFRPSYARSVSRGPME